MEYIIAMEYNYFEAKYQHPPPDEIDLIPILSIDGGDIRGIIPGVILEYLEKQLQEIDENPKAKLADYFDVIAGTSTGGLVATLLTTPKEHGCQCQEPKFTAKNIVQFYLDNAPKIFDQSRFSWWKPRLARHMLGPLYNGKELRRIVENLLGKETRLSDTLTNVIIPTFDIQSMKPVIFSSFKVPEHPDINASMYDICIATSAAPTYLPGHKFSNNNRIFNLVDGGVAANNPTAVAIEEALRHVGIEKKKKHIKPTAVATEKVLMHVGIVFSDVAIDEARVGIEKKKKHVMQDLKRPEKPEYSAFAIEEEKSHVGIEKKKKHVMQDLKRPEQPEYSDVAMEEAPRRDVIEKKKKHNNPTAVATKEVRMHVGIEKKMKHVMQDLKDSKDCNTVLIHPYSQFLVLSLGTGTRDDKSKYDAETSSKWGLIGWVVSNDNPLKNIFMQASDELVDYRVNNVFNIIRCPDQFLRIQADSLTGDLPSVDKATKENLEALKKVGTNLLDETVRRLNPDTGNYDPVQNGGTNAQELYKFAKRLSDIRKSRVENGMGDLAAKKENVISLVKQNITFMSRVTVRK